MKCLVIILFLVKLIPAWGRENELLKCLGAEEKRMHLSKDTGPIYDLNQKLIAEMIQIPNAEVNSADTADICSHKAHSESWRLLELSIRKGKGLFIISKSIPDMQKQVTEGMIDDYFEATKEILLGFMAQIQALSPTPTCLREE